MSIFFAFLIPMLHDKLTKQGCFHVSEITFQSIFNYTLHPDNWDADSSPQNPFGQ